MSDDRDPWARACDGDAFGVLFDRHHTRVRLHAGRLVEDAADRWWLPGQDAITARGPMVTVTEGETRT